MISSARALWFDTQPIIVTDDWIEVALHMTWEQAMDEWVKTHNVKN